MLKDRFVEIKAARLLKDNGFDEVSFKFYDNDENLCNGVNINRSPKMWSAPTQTTALEWIRRKYGVHIVIDVTCDEDRKSQEFFYVFKNISNGRVSFDHMEEYFKKYDDCVEAAIDTFMSRIDGLGMKR